MPKLEDEFAQSYLDEAYGGVVEVFVPGIQGASIKGDKGDQGDKGEKGDVGPRGQVGPQGPQGSAGVDGRNGITFFPSVSEEGVLTWTNDGGASNPLPVSIKGPKGDEGSVEGYDLSTFVTKESLSGFVEKSSLAAVATSGAYSDLIGLPVIPEGDKVAQNIEATGSRPVLLARGTPGEYQTWYTDKVMVNAASGDIVATTFNGMDVTKMSRVAVAVDGDALVITTK